MCHKNLITYAGEHRTISRLHPCDLASKNVFPNRHRGEQQAVKCFMNVRDVDGPNCEERKHRSDVDEAECEQDEEGVLQRDRDGKIPGSTSTSHDDSDTAVASNSKVENSLLAAAVVKHYHRMQDASAADIDDIDAVGSPEQTDPRIHIDGAGLGEPSPPHVGINELQQPGHPTGYDANGKASTKSKRENRKRGGKTQRERKEKLEAAASVPLGQRPADGMTEAQHQPEQDSIGRWSKRCRS